MNSFNQNSWWKETKLTYLRLFEVLGLVVKRWPDFNFYLESIFQDYKQLENHYEK